MTLPVAASWFALEVVDDGLVRIDEPHADELVRGNVWWRRGRDADLLVDTGLGVGPLRSAVEAAAELVGAAPREPIVVLTHGHLDHAGGAGAFPDVRAHPADVPAAVADLAGAAFAAGIGLAEGVYPLPPLLVDAAPHAGWDGRAAQPAPRITTPLADGDAIDLGDRVYRVLHLPGHTPGSIGLVDDASGELFAGDVVYDDVLLDDLHDSEPAAYRASLERLLALPITVVRPGHGDSFGREDLVRIARGYLA
ncbi:MBL fold metallo-hydrolase [Agrococcus jejuensis]|uniref:Glyoxylase, beta-lactamase superfamily II n=1 Tax=Agrococcus jejuensis TaxID=399736 RepID=A0A1G8A0Y4_9MICO|nr:MBL fold metallo-hydrolase [Agrococcus jejuensis]SDH14589.1 Glyoxylase, beta-lactamase superfamily II [Agrococcus jejuensis]